MNAAITAEAALAERARAALMDTYARQPVTIVAGEGVWVRDADGRELLDMVAGIAVSVLGHGHPAVRAALERGAGLVHTSNLYFTEPQVELAERLAATAFAGRAFFCNSGAEANEAAIKLARRWGRSRRPEAHVIVCMEGAFHGRTLGALSATPTAWYQEPFAPLVPGFRTVPFGDVDALRAAVDASVCAVLVEPVQGESGIHALPSGALAAMRALCDETDTLLIVDEVQCGMGRTGRWWAHQHEGAVPDVMTSAKGLGGGVPIGAVLAAPRADAFQPGDHGSTFGGGPLACTVALAVMDVMEDQRLVERAHTAGRRLRDGILALRDDGLPVADVRGRGLMLGVGLSADIAPRVAAAALDAGLIVNAIGTRTVRMVPALIISDSEIDEALHRLRAALIAALAAS